VDARRCEVIDSVATNESASSTRIELDTPAFPVPAGVSTAQFAGFDEEGRFQVQLSSGGAPVCALSTVRLDVGDAGVPVVVAYEQESPGRLIIIGRVLERAVAADPIARVDGARIVVRAEEELELRCGDASIVLTKAGKVLVKGNYVLTRSRGANRIKGAYVDIN